MSTGTNVMNSVENEAELVPCVTRSADVEVPLSLADPTRGSVTFCEVVSVRSGGYH